ncbi:MAG: prepilin peptidase [Opitutales bacterium]|nr:prepilin peptidase [Opitutales bacterium]
MLQSYTLVNELYPWFYPVLVFCFGACVGSFLNVCIYRIPLEQSVVKPRSHCMKCGKPIAWYDNIPILTWFILRGKARCCGAPFSVRYAMVELFTGLLFLSVWLTYAPLPALALMVFLSFMVAGSFIDLDHMIIPDRFTVGGFVVGVALSALVPALHGYVSPLDPYFTRFFQGGITAVLGGFIGSALVLWIMLLAEIILRKEAMGAGDVKLMGAIGAFCGWKGAVFALFGGSFAGVFIILPLVLLLRRKKPAPVADKSAEASVGVAEAAEDASGDAVPADEDYDPTHIPFGPSLALGAFLYLVFFRDTVDLYFDTFKLLFFGN